MILMSPYEEKLTILRVTQRKNKHKYLSILIEMFEYVNFGTSRCYIVFGENCNSLNTRNSGPKFAKFAYFLQTFSILLLFENKIHFCHQQDCFILKMYNFVYMSVQSRFKKSTSGLN